MFVKYVVAVVQWYPEAMPWVQWGAGGPLRYFDKWPLEPLHRGVQAYYMWQLGTCRVCVLNDSFADIL